MAIDVRETYAYSKGYETMYFHQILSLFVDSKLME